MLKLSPQFDLNESNNIRHASAILTVSGELTFN